ncbi:MAG: acyl--CoA ligase, partial [Deltaproteobacteria bacterium]|nr:acyl--CoA ligase [Deltaproteobacteria bacterium]
MLVQTLVDALRGRAVSHGSAPALWRKQGDSPYRPWTWSECAQSASRIARGLLSLNLPPMSTLAMLCGHRPEWLPLELGAMGAGLVAAPLYPTWPTDLLVAVLRRIGAAAVVVESPAQLAILKEARAGLPQLALGIALEGPVEGERWVHSLAEVMARGDGQSSSDWTELGQGLDPNAVALCAVTPGTVDAPRLVRHSHAALVAHARRFSKAVGLGEQDSVLARRTPAL